ncbi:MAG TPA: HAMP domain-containing sensor histidine kinase [Phycisphaerae bacterium]|nr:HAMP domain-containing sensor histidine kinase [Phycisphaerae bacterium]
MGVPNESGNLADASTTGPHRPAHTDVLISLVRLHWFIRLRWGMICAALLILTAERFLAPGPGRPIQLAVVLAALAAVNLIWMAVSRFLRTRFEAASSGDEERATPSALFFANAQVAVDLLFLTLILRYTGGVESPMAVFYLFHMAIGSLILRKWHALIQGIWAVLLFVVLGVGELRGWVVPHYAFLPSMQGLYLYQSPEYVVSLFAVVACGIMGMLYFTLHIATQLSDRERQLRRVVDALWQSQLAITDLQQRRSRFMQTAAHQLKTPLAVVQTLAGLISDGVIQGEAIGDTCKKIMFRCRDGINQVTELLTLARLQEADPGKRPPSPTDVRKVLADLCQKNAPLAEGKQITLSMQVPEGVDLSVEVAPDDLRDCVGNLIDNAIKFTFGPGKVTVTAGRCDASALTADTTEPASAVAAGPDATGVFVSVSDTGMGIDPSTLRGRGGPGGEGSIFDAFRRGNQALAAGISGTGLGLSIVREVVEQSGGQIHVRSQPGQGTTFTVIIPARRPTLAGVSVRSTRVSRIVIEESQGEGANTTVVIPDESASENRPASKALTFEP